jgi:hypothetical protein
MILFPIVRWPQIAALSGPGGGGGGPVDFSLVDTATASTTNPTINVDFGVADADRYIIVTAGSSFNTGAGGNTLNAPTIGGVASTTIQQHETAPGSSARFIGIYIALVPTGTTGDVVFVSSCNRFSIAVYRAVGLLSATPTDTGIITNSSTGGAISLDISAGGCAVCMALNFNGSAFTVSGLTSNNDFTSALSLQDTVHASGESVAGETASVDISINLSGAKFAAASWR